MNIIITEVLAPYGIDTLAFLASFGAEMNLNGTCEFHDDSETCERLNG